MTELNWKFHSYALLSLHYTWGTTSHTDPIFQLLLTWKRLFYIYWNGYNSYDRQEISLLHARAYLHIV